MQASSQVGPVIAKLQGSVDSGTIVPPTWSKGTHPEIVPVWKDALNLLSTANEIRIIGYSLPTADAYVRYLFKSAAMQAEHLKAIDVICLDPDGSTRSRYGEFVDFQFFRFRNANTTGYLDHFMELTFRGSGLTPRSDWADRLEDAHHGFMNLS